MWGELNKVHVYNKVYTLNFESLLGILTKI